MKGTDSTENYTHWKWVTLWYELCSIRLGESSYPLFNKILKPMSYAIFSVKGTEYCTLRKWCTETRETIYIICCQEQEYCIALWLRFGNPWVLLYSVWREPSIYEAGPEFIAWTRERSWGFTARGIYLIPSHIQLMLYMYKLNPAWRKSDTRFLISGFCMHQFTPRTWVSQSSHFEF